MAFFNYVTREITLKVVYYGPGLSGKTTNLQYLHSVLDSSSRGKFISLSTESDRTLFFDFLPVDLGKIRDFSVRFQLYTVPGQIRYNATRRLVLKGADAIVFVADSQRDMREHNIESFINMKENLASNNINPEEIPVVLQYNKRDLPGILSTEELAGDLNKKSYPEIEAVAIGGAGVQETFRLVTKTLLKDISMKHNLDVSAVRDERIGLEPEKEQEIVEAVLSQQTAAPPVIEKEAEVPGRGASSAASQPSHRPIPDVTRTTTVSGRPEPAGDGYGAVTAGLREISQSLKGLREALSVLYTEIKESGKQQAEIMKIVKEMNRSLIQTKRKKRWFFISI